MSNTPESTPLKFTVGPMPVPQHWNSTANGGQGDWEPTQGYDGAVYWYPRAAYDAKMDMLKVQSMQQKWRDEFSVPNNALNATIWDTVQTGAGQTISVAGGVLTIATGTTANSETILMTQAVFTVSCRAIFTVQLSQRIANQEVYLELVSVDPSTGLPDGLHAIGWLLDGTTATQGKYFVQNGGIALTSGASTIVSTATYTILEIEAHPDEGLCHSRTIDSTSGRPNTYVRNQQLPDPNASYKVRIRVKNLGAAPASSTNVQLQNVSVSDYAELTAEITGARGSQVAGQGLPVWQAGGTAPTGTHTIGGQAAHDAVVSGNPVRIGGRALNANYAAVAAGDAADLVTTLVGALITRPYSIPEGDWQYAGAGAVTTTADVPLKGAGGSGIRNYVTALQLQNTHATVATEVVVKDGSTVIWRGYLPANMTAIVNVPFPTPLRGSMITVMNFAAITTGANIYVNAQGYQAP